MTEFMLIITYHNLNAIKPPVMSCYFMALLVAMLQWAQNAVSNAKRDSSSQKTLRLWNIAGVNMFS